MYDWARNIVFSNQKVLVRSRAGLRTDGFMLGSCSNRPRINNDFSAVFRHEV